MADACKVEHDLSEETFSEDEGARLGESCPKWKVGNVRLVIKTAGDTRHRLFCIKFILRPARQPSARQLGSAMPSGARCRSRLGDQVAAGASRSPGPVRIHSPSPQP